MDPVLGPNGSVIMHAWGRARRRVISGINEQKQPEIAFRWPLTHYLSQLRAERSPAHTDKCDTGVNHCLHNAVGTVHMPTALSDCARKRRTNDKRRLWTTPAKSLQMCSRSKSHIVPILWSPLQLLETLAVQKTTHLAPRLQPPVKIDVLWVGMQIIDQFINRWSSLISGKFSWELKCHNEKRVRSTLFKASITLRVHSGTFVTLENSENTLNVCALTLGWLLTGHISTQKLFPSNLFQVYWAHVSI